MRTLERPDATATGAHHALTPLELIEQMGAPLDPASYDWSTAREVQLTDDEVFRLTYAAQVEWATEGTFESLDITDDPVVHDFLRVWLDQEVVHGELLARFLAASGVDVPKLHVTDEQRRAARRGRRVNQLAHRLLGDDFFGVHMMWGAVNELTTLRFYRMIRRDSEHPLLRRLLRDLIAQEAIHHAFYRTMAAQRLEGNRRAQLLVRLALRHLWSPVGVGLRSREDADRLFLGLLDDEPDQVAQIDSTIERVPGLDGLHLVARTLERARRAA